MKPSLFPSLSDEQLDLEGYQALLANGSAPSPRLAEASALAWRHCHRCNGNGSSAPDGEVENSPTSLDVAGILKGLGFDETTLIVTLLSDPGLTGHVDQAGCERLFGKGVWRLLEGLRKLQAFPDLDEHIEAPEQVERLRRLLVALVDDDVRPIIIVLAYRLAWLRALGKAPVERRRKFARITLSIYAPIANRLGLGQLKWELEDLAFRYVDPVAYKNIARLLDERRENREEYIAQVTDQLRRALAEQGVDADVMGRPKHIYSIWRKMQRKQLSFDQLLDLRAVRVLVNDLHECYQVLGVVHAIWRHIPKEFDDYIANPKENGYRSLHTAVFGPEGKTLEVQIRTHAMHREAELGVAAHWLYKEGGKMDPVLGDAISRIRALLENLDRLDDAEDRLEALSASLISDRIYVLTPKGQVIDLPKGATPLDFAYAVHTEIGHRCRGAKVSGRIVQLNHELATGDQVEILTGARAEPSRDWLSAHLGYLKTARARAKVRGFFNRQQAEDGQLKEGQSIVERVIEQTPHAAMRDPSALAKHFKYGQRDDFLRAVGQGKISRGQLQTALKPPELEADEPQLTLRSPSSEGQRDAIRIQGVGNLLTQFAGCCRPVPGDPVIGYITQGRGLTVHRADCKKVRGLAAQQRERLVEVEWDREDSTRLPVDVRIVAFDRTGLLRDITTIAAHEQINVLAAHTLTDRVDAIAVITLTLEIADTVELERVLNRIGQLPHVRDVMRVGAGH